jgi:hypothetical protein
MVISSSGHINYDSGNIDEGKKEAIFDILDLNNKYLKK